MKLSELKTSDRFYWKGSKYSVFFTMKNPPKKAYKVCCLDWPMPNGSYDMPSGRIVKPLKRLSDQS